MCSMEIIQSILDVNKQKGRTQYLRPLRFRARQLNRQENQNQKAGPHHLHTVRIHTRQNRSR